MNEIHQYLLSNCCKCYTSDDAQRDIASLSIALSIKTVLNLDRGLRKSCKRLVALREFEGDIVKCIQNDLSKTFDAKYVPDPWFIKLILPLDESDDLLWIPYEWKKTLKYPPSKELCEYIRVCKGRLDVDEMMRLFD